MKVDLSVVGGVLVAVTFYQFWSLQQTVVAQSLANENLHNLVDNAPKVIKMKVEKSDQTRKSQGQYCNQTGEPPLPF